MVRHCAYDRRNLPCLKVGIGLELIKRNRFFVAILAIYLCSSLFMINKYPRVWVDEPWESITAYTLEHDGRLFNPTLEGRDGYGQHFLEPRILLSLVVAPFFALFGVGPVQGRLASVLVGALLLVGGYMFGKRFLSKRGGLLIAWCLSIETMIFISARTVRPEIYLAAIQMFSMYYFFSALETGSLRKYFSAGLLLGVALWTHPNALLYLGAVVTIFVIEKKLAFIKSREFWALTIASVITFAPYAIYVIAVDAHDGFATWWSQLAGRPGEVVQSGWLVASLAGEWQRIVDFTQFPGRILIVLIYLYALGVSFRSKSRVVKYILVTAFVEFVLSVAIIANKSTLYASTYLPLLIILLAKYFDDRLPQFKKGTTFPPPDNGWKTKSSLVALSLFAVFSVNQIGGDGFLLLKNSRCSYTDVTASLREAIPSGSRVWGSMTFWFAFYDQPYRTQYTFLKDIDSFKPQYMITGDPEVWGKPFWKDLRTKVDSIVTDRGTLVKEIPSNCYGNLKVFRLRW
jgi:Dolichyl-phosphate-mannose-protein mannosyltransferase